MKKFFKYHFNIKFILHDLACLLGHWQLLIWYRHKKYFDGKEAKKALRGGAIVILNHVGYGDPFVMQTLYCYRRFHFVTAEEVFEKPVARFCYKHLMLANPISRNKPTLAIFKRVIELTSNGCLVGIFPEGHISEDRTTVNDFKGGTLLMAYKANVPIIPIFHTKRKKWWKRTQVAIGKPFYVKDIVGPTPSNEKINEASKLLHDYEIKLASLIPENKK